MGLHRVGLWTSQRYWLLNNPDPVWGQGKAVEISRLPQAPSSASKWAGPQRPGGSSRASVGSTRGWWWSQGQGHAECVLYGPHPVWEPRAVETLRLSSVTKGWLGRPAAPRGSSRVDWAEKEGMAFRTEAAGMILAPQDEDLSCASRPPDWRSVPQLHHCLQYAVSWPLVPLFLPSPEPSHHFSPLGNAL